MPHASDPSGALEFVASVADAYEAMWPFAGGDEPSLGGHLFYAGALDAHARVRLVAANIAGAASLAATADAAAQRQVIRDGVADFVVTSLDEALRILKNEIRKRQPAAVCVALDPSAVEREMRERGVQPDLLPPPAGPSAFAARGAKLLQPVVPSADAVQLTWTVAQAPALWLPRIDVIAVKCCDESAAWQRRWLLHAPRYLGRLARGMRLLHCGRATAERLIEQVRKSSSAGEIGVPIEIQVRGEGVCDKHIFAPARAAD